MSISFGLFSQLKLKKKSNQKKELQTAIQIEYIKKKKY